MRSFPVSRLVISIILIGSHVNAGGIGLLETAASDVPYFANHTLFNVKLPADTIDPFNTLAQRVQSWFTDQANLCCNTASCNGEPYCRRVCPGSCSWNGWSNTPTYDLLSFTIDDPNPQSYSIVMVQSKNSTNLTNVTALDSFTYSETWGDSVTVSSTTTFSTGVDVETSLDFEVAKVKTTFHFSFSTSQSKSTTTSDSKTWSTTTSGIVVPACGGTYTECYILVGNYNPTYTAVYEVNGSWKNINCAGNWYYTSPASTEAMEAQWGWTACSKCEPNCPVHTTMPNTIKVTGTVNSVLGNSVQCTYKSYNMPTNQCYH